MANDKKPTDVEPRNVAPHAKAEELRQKALSSDDIDSEVLNLQAWGYNGEVKAMSGAQRAALYQAAKIPGTDEFDFTSLYPRVVVDNTYVPGTMDRIFRIEDIAALNEKSAKTVGLIAETCLRLSGIGTGELEKAKNG